MQKISMCLFFFLKLTVFFLFCNCAVANQEIDNQINTLKSLIDDVKRSGKDVSREESTVRTAELFSEWVDLDSNSISENAKFYAKHPKFKDDPNEHAKQLPKYEREATLEILDKAIGHLNDVKNNRILRKPVPNLDYSRISINENQFQLNGQPVFLNDYIWKEGGARTNEYFGDTNGYYMSPNHIKNDKGEPHAWVVNDLRNDTNTKIGQTFIDHNNIPKWAKDKYQGFEIGSRSFGKYDIDHPGARALYSDLFKAFIPLLKDNRSTDLGYMLWNEPSFFTKKGVWNTAGVSSYTTEKFRDWLRHKHNSIQNLNVLWGTNFSNFNRVNLTIPIDGNLQGRPEWYDWVRFNQVRVSEWFGFLNDEIRRWDSDSKTHIKLMPWLWTGNARDHGMDFERLLELGDIVGFDAEARYSDIYDRKAEWQNTYSFDWQSSIMSIDFFRSVQPNQVLWDSENHFLTAVGFQEKDLDPDYVRSAFWLAFTHGMSGSYTWVWGRDEDGTIKSDRGTHSEYIFDVTHQPKALNELTLTMMDLNAHANDIIALQELDKPLRVFYSETSAINSSNYMSNIKPTYEAIYFEGLPVGFATKNIIINQAKHGEIIVVKNSEYVTNAEFSALQKHINQGGAVLIDSNSLRYDEYGRSRSAKLSGSGDQVISFSSLNDLKTKLRRKVAQENISPQIEVTQRSGKNKKTVAWRVASSSKNTYIVSLVNLGKNNITVDLANKNNNVSIQNEDLLTGMATSNVLTLGPREVKFVKVASGTTHSGNEFASLSDDISVLVSAKKYTFLVDYSADKERDIAVEFWSSTGWLGGSVERVASGTGQSAVMLELPSAPAAGSGYILKTSIRPINSDWTQTIKLNQIDNITVTEAGAGNVPPPSWTNLEIRHSGKCIDVAFGEVTNGSIYHQWRCDSNNVNQHFKFESRGDGWYGIKSKHSGKCLDVAAGSTTDGAKLHQWTCSDSNNNQSWRLVDSGSGWFELRAKVSNKCIDIANYSSENGAAIAQYQCAGKHNQQLRFSASQ